MIRKMIDNVLSVDHNCKKTKVYFGVTILDVLFLKMQTDLFIYMSITAMTRCFLVFR